MWGDILTVTEANRCNVWLGELENVEWARPLIKKIERAGGLKAENKDLLFELNFAGELQRKGSTAIYEYATGAGTKTVDFAIDLGALWLIELVRIGTSKATRNARRGDEHIWTMFLSSDAEDARQSEEGELLLAQQKISEKATKFRQ